MANYECANFRHVGYVNKLTHEQSSLMKIEMKLILWGYLCVNITINNKRKPLRPNQLNNIIIRNCISVLMKVVKFPSTIIM